MSVWVMGGRSVYMSMTWNMILSGVTNSCLWRGVFTGGEMWPTEFHFCEPSKEPKRTGLPNSMHLCFGSGQMVESPLRDVETLLERGSDIIAKIIHSRPGVPPGCEPGVLGYLGSY